MFREGWRRIPSLLALDSNPYTLLIATSTMAGRNPSPKNEEKHLSEIANAVMIGPKDLGPILGAYSFCIRLLQVT